MVLAPVRGHLKKIIHKNRTKLDLLQIPVSGLLLNLLNYELFASLLSNIMSTGTVRKFLMRKKILVYKKF